ncbi:uncharacterized protein LOC108850590 [Raphanus sativus]|uniref:Uncharacterized protein LOC108850590 n=1 Tax=Raphanus sativus TaxID=3726 RepID=A0A6J0N552_RAPSA|nr:uncharacterized protein LOC108850590 [Raphanus sativus]
MFKGHKIHATCRRTLIESKKRLLTVGSWRYIRNFQIAPAGGAYRTTNHSWKKSFNQNTAVTRSNHVNDELYLSLIDFQTVLSGTLDDNFLIDVLGQVIDCGDVETMQCTGGKQRKKLEFTLSDLKINDDAMTLTSFQSNDDSQDDNNNRVGILGKRGQRDKWLLFPTKTIYEMITSTQRVLKTGTTFKKLNGKEIVQHNWWCEECKDSVIDVSPSDDSGISNIMILDRVANNIVSETPEKLLNGSWEELQDPTLVPDCINDLVGKEFMFGVYIDKENVAYGSEFYKVGKIYKDRLTSVPDPITPSLSSKQLTLTSGEEGQTLSEVGIFLPRPVFSHGQLYVAVSRVTSKKGLKILIVDSEGKSQRQTKNVVYREVFDNL